MPGELRCTHGDARCDARSRAGVRGTRTGDIGQCRLTQRPAPACAFCISYVRTVTGQSHRDTRAPGGAAQFCIVSKRAVNERNTCACTCARFIVTTWCPPCLPVFIRRYACSRRGARTGVVRVVAGTHATSWLVTSALHARVGGLGLAMRRRCAGSMHARDCGPYRAVAQRPRQGSA